VIEAEVERYSDPQSFAKEVNLPLLGTARLEAVPGGASVSRLLQVNAPPELATALDGLAETRRSLTLRSLLVAGFPEDRECFAIGLALAREWSRRGLKLAVVDLDFWNPTIVRPRPNPNEGLVDVLEYGCSFRRVAWEIVAQSLWVVGPGSYPPDPHRIVEHPDWERASRSFAAHVDVTLYVAPLLERSGFVGRLSKRMDGVLLAASVERIARTDLRDAFLELWGSDAPMIGCVGIEAGRPQADETPATRDEATSGAQGGPAPEIYGSATPARAGAFDASTDLIGEASWTHTPEPRPAAAEPAYAGVDRPHPPARSDAPDAVERELASILQREVELGRPLVRPIHRSRAGLFAGVAAGLAVAASIVAVLMRHPTLPPSAETMPAGTEEVEPAPAGGLSAGLGTSPSPLPTGETPAPAKEAAVPPSKPAPASAANTAPAGAANSAPVTSQSSPPTAAKPSQPTAAKAAPAATAKAPAVASPAPAPDASKPYRVHVASFRSEAKVQEIVRGLKARGAEAWYERAADAPGYYRVFVGRFATEKEAAAHARWLLEQGWVDRAQAFPLTAR
jgi:septal ring-binding cell division protein DamX